MNEGAEPDGLVEAVVRSQVVEHGAGGLPCRVLETDVLRLTWPFLQHRRPTFR